MNESTAPASTAPNGHALRIDFLARPRTSNDQAA